MIAVSTYILSSILSLLLFYDIIKRADHELSDGGVTPVPAMLTLLFSAYLLTQSLIIFILNNLIPTR